MLKTMLRPAWGLVYCTNRLGLSRTIPSCYYSVASAIEPVKEDTKNAENAPRITRDAIYVNSNTYPTDSYTNITPSILAKTTRRLHLNPRHPVSIVRSLIESHFGHFTPFNNFSPVVTTRQNFDDLGFPADHPGRAPSDTYYLNENILLRTHTSAHQLEGLRSGKSKFLISADVYRRDEIDATHYPVFHQMEGFQYFEAKAVEEQIKADMALRKNGQWDRYAQDETRISDQNPIQACHDPVASHLVGNHLKWALEGMIRSVFGLASNGSEDIKVRWIDAYFPFTSPSWEMEVFFRGQWLEVCGCGVVQQNIMNMAGLHEKIGWAFGFGLERIAMVLFEIPDIRLFWSTDERFLSQFQPGTITKFQPFSKFPPCPKDVSFWLNDPNRFHENDICSVIREVAGDIVEDVKKIDDFTHPKTNRRSLCYRIVYRSMDRNVTNDEINSIQEKVRQEIVEKLNVELR
ncbi:uncharacterized protein VTP21DRAFT_1751 [Calcarisporiella thermophila]|uniref:uncharacterized protein n=1 Tax=Calcarisporiella thermophila TaxID=911321 RepID=UPI0037422FEA